MFALVDPHAISTVAQTWGGLMLTVAVKGLVLLGMALLLTFALRRAAAATRHLVWTIAVLGLFALPLLGGALPGWSIPGVSMPSGLGPANGEVGSTVHGEAARNLPIQDFESRDLLATMTSDGALVGDGGKAESSTEPSAPTHFARRDVGKNAWQPVQKAANGSEAFIASSGEAVRTEPSAPSVTDAILAQVKAWSPWVWALLVWELGVLLVGGWLALGWVHLRALERRCVPVEDAEWTGLAEAVADEIGLKNPPALVRTDDAMTPLTWGILRPKVLLPASADAWSFERRCDVLRHEFAHVHRRDLLSQLFAQLTCALLWFHPLPWIAAAKMRLERERACDDRVLLAGSRASSYAGHLLDMARSLRSEHSLAAATIGMARRSQLGERMDSLLDEAPRGRRTSKATRIGLTAALALLLLPLAALRPSSIEAAPPERDGKALLEQPRWRGEFGAPTPPAVVAPVPPALDLHRFLSRDAASLPNQMRREEARERAFFPRRAPATDLFFGLPDGRTSVRVPRSTSAPSTPRGFAVRRDGLPVRLNASGKIHGGQRLVSGVISSDGDDLSLVQGTMWTGIDDLDEVEGYEVDARHTTWKMVEDDSELEVEMSGHIRFAADETDVEWMDEDAYFDLRWEEGRDRRRLEIEVDRDGAMQRTYWVRGREKDYDDDAREWFSNALSEFMLRGGVATKERVARWVAADGVEGTIDRIVDLESDHAASLHWGALLAMDDLSNDDRAKVLEAISSSVDSDYEKTRILTEGVDFLFASPELANGTVAIIESLDSDYERGRAVQMALELGDLDDDQLERILVLADGLNSDFEKARVLTAFPRAEAGNGRLGASYFRVVGGMDSDFEKTRSLIDALPLALEDAQAREAMWAAVRDLDSDFEKARLVAALAPKLIEDDEMVMEALDVIDTLDSDFEKARVLEEFVDAAARSEEVRRAFDAVAQSIDGDHEYGRVMRALKRAER